MAAENSFDIVGQVDRMEVRNAVQQTTKEVHTRFDFKGSKAAIEETGDELVLTADDEGRLKSLRQISAESRDKAGRARERKLTPEEYTGASFSVSNLGMFDIEHFTAIINPPEAGILAVGSIAQVPVVVNGQVVPRRRMRMTMSCDHRVIDGATGAKFLQTLKLILENPLALVW